MGAAYPDRENRMADDAPDTGAEQEPNTNQQSADTEPDWKAEAEKWKGLARKHEETWKANSEKVAEYDRLVEASKTDQQRLEERAAAAEGKVTGLAAENLRYRVGLAKGLPPQLIGRLQGASQEELEKDADVLFEQFGTATKQVPDLRSAAGQRPVASEQSADDWLRRLAGRG